MVMIPLTFHFAFFRGSTNWAWRDYHTLCLRSCNSRAGAEQIVVHYDRDGDGAAWDEAKALPNIEWRLVSPDWSIHGKPVSDQRIMVDYYRLQVLQSEGGFFCDLDFVFLKSFNQIRHYPAVIGTQCKQKKKLACGLIGAIAGSMFVNAYLDEYKNWTVDEERTPWTFANVIPWRLSETYPVYVLPRIAFYPLAFSNKAFWSGLPIQLKSSYAIHLWQPLHPELSVDVLMTTCLAPEIEKLNTPHQVRGIIQVRSGLLTFD